ncbi:MAG: hypothetical protein KDI45_02240 [Candidatus Accumulibacter sp.]|nr:hypothetical protein [Accumulibacter sp.]MCB1965091.1 hypothetical protein [Accumulibacter sp.]
MLSALHAVGRMGEHDSGLPAFRRRCEEETRRITRQASGRAIGDTAVVAKSLPVRSPCRKIDLVNASIVN